MANNDDTCDKCSRVSYQVPIDQSLRNYTRLSDGRAVLHTDPLLALNYTNAGQSVSKHSNQCKTYFLRQGCSKDGACSGTTQVTVKKTVFPEVRSTGSLCIFPLLTCLNLMLT